MRICALSDLHGHDLPALPPADVVIIAGDICPDAVEASVSRDRPDLQLKWFEQFARQFDPAGPPVIATWGNHDFCGDIDAHGVSWHGAVRIVIDDVVEVVNADGTERLRVWCSPWSLPFGPWTFNRNEAELASTFRSIAAPVDVMVTHGPPLGYGDVAIDYSGAGRPPEHVGSRSLAEAIVRLEPAAVVCGHMHSGYGSYRLGRSAIYNVAVVDDFYQLAHGVTMFELSCKAAAQ